MSKIRIHILHCGKIGISREMAYGGEKCLMPWASAMITPLRKRVWLPVSTYLIEHPKGLILVDTGWSRSISPNGVLDGSALSKQTSPILSRELCGMVGPGETAYEQLSEMGITPGDLDYILLTNLDADHVSGLRELADAKHILAAEEEAWWSYRLSANHCTYLWDDLPVEKYYFKGMGLGPTGRALDLFGDSSLIMVETPGHSKGTIAVKISWGGKFVLLCSDSGYSDMAWREMALPGMAFDKTYLHRSLRWIQNEASQPECVAALASHDSDVVPHIIEL